MENTDLSKLFTEAAQASYAERKHSPYTAILKEMAQALSELPAEVNVQADLAWGPCEPATDPLLLRGGRLLHAYGTLEIQGASHFFGAGRFAEPGANPCLFLSDIPDFLGCVDGGPTRLLSYTAGSMDRFKQEVTEIAAQHAATKCLLEEAGPVLFKNYNRPVIEGLPPAPARNKPHRFTGG